MRFPTLRVVFDRKKQASREKKGLVQIEVRYGAKRKWVSAGVRIYSDQWKDSVGVVNSTMQFELNDEIRKRMRAIEQWISDHPEFSWPDFNRFIENNEGSPCDFLDYVRDMIAKRKDIKSTTKKTQRKIVPLLREFGRIETFEDLTPARIAAFDRFLHNRQIKRLTADGKEIEDTMRQSSIYGIHRILKTYVNMALNEGLIKDTPYKGLRLRRGDSKPDRFLTLEEVHKIERAPYNLGYIAKTRDLFVLQCYTGLSYSDLKEFDAKKIQNFKGSVVYRNQRHKTGETFTIVLLPTAIAILERYEYKLSVPSMQRYNAYLKLVAKGAGINKPLSSHWARRTAAVMFATHGVSYEVIAKILGHASVATTEKFYANLNIGSIVDAMKETGL